MRSASRSAPRNARRPLFRSRAAAFVAALLAHLLLVGLVLTLPPKFQKLAPPELASFHLLPNPRPAPKPAPRAKTVTKVRQPKSAAAPKAPAPAHVVATPTKLNILPIELATSDIGKLPSHPAAEPPAGGSGGSGDGDSSVASGQGPGGETLYNAEWFTEPTDAQLSFYLPRDRRVTGWGIIACRTAPRYRVEDCVPMEESPFGSRISQSILQAAWQFRVLPPRLGGKAMVGSWVRIKITFSERDAK